ncbi:receptor-transporting protein 4 [Hippopotamus amphibius kiboko]|uniref:receptor-transporting protein 4 n=1 Tax=Hippopotamus amphibius kiboko TaxID=575201 RepID=UPI002591F664|nr:receptor-transporting protein 4 [Hippopotamus amphibius kiboko]
MDSRPQSKTMVLDVGTWEQTFQELIGQEKPRARWTLKLDGKLRPDCVALGWKQYQQKAFGRFLCSSCRRSWASAQVQILCHMYLERRTSQGKVLMRLFGQRCQKCSKSQFEKPEFSPDSSKRILNNLVERILERFYRNGIRKVSEAPVIPEVPLNGHHDMANCEACVLGMCIQNLQNCTMEPATSSLSHMKTGSSSPRIGDVCGPNRAGNQSAETKETQGSGYSCTHKGSGPGHATAGTQMPRAGPQVKREAGQMLIPGADWQAARGTGPQPILVAGSLPSGWTELRPIQAVSPLATGRTHSQSTLRTRPRAARMTYSQAIRMSGQQLTQEAQTTQGAGLQVKDPQSTRGAIPKATAGSDTQAPGRAGPPPPGSNSQPTRGAIPKTTSGSDTQAPGRAGPPPPGSNSQPTRGAIPKTTSGSDTQAPGRAGPPPLGSNSQPTLETGPGAACRTFGGSQVAYRQGRCSPGGSAPDSVFRFSPPVPPNDSLNQEQLIRWGYVCVVALFAFFVSKCL